MAPSSVRLTVSSVTFRHNPGREAGDVLRRELKAPDPSTLPALSAASTRGHCTEDTTIDGLNVGSLTANRKLDLTSQVFSGFDAVQREYFNAAGVK